MTRCRGLSSRECGLYAALHRIPVFELPYGRAAGRNDSSIQQLVAAFVRGLEVRAARAPGLGVTRAERLPLDCEHALPVRHRRRACTTSTCRTAEKIKVAANVTESPLRCALCQV